MTTNARTDESLREAVDLLERLKTFAAVAKKLNVDESTVRRRVAEAKVRGIVAASERKLGYSLPVLPEKDEPLDTVIDRIIAEQRRQRARRDAEEWMAFTVEGNTPFALVFVGDPHVDECDLAQLKSDLDLIEETDRMWAVGLGDWANAWAGRLKAKYADQEVSEKTAYRLVEWLFAKTIWWLILLGNHDGMRWHGSGSPLRWMRNASGLPPKDWEAKFTIKCGKASWKIWAAHDFPGNSQFNPLHGPVKRALHTGGMADLYVAGDHHTYGLAHTQNEHTKAPYWAARARGYKPQDDYALEKGFGEQTMGHSIAAVFDPSDRSLVCFHDLRKAASYLKFLGA